MCSAPGHDGPEVWVFCTGGFHRLFATKPVSSETSKAERRSSGDHGSIRDSWPIAFSGYPGGPRVSWETTCARHTAPTILAETRSRTRESREPDGPPPEKIPSRERTRSETLKLFVVLDDWRRSTLLCSRRSERSWQFFWLRSAAPFLAVCLWPLQLHKTLRTGPGLVEATTAALLNKFLKS